MYNGRRRGVLEFTNASVASRVWTSKLYEQAIGIKSRRDNLFVVGAAAERPWSWSFVAATTRIERFVPSSFTYRQILPDKVDVRLYDLIQRFRSSPYS